MRVSGSLSVGVRVSAGAHALGRCHAEYSRYVGPWTGMPTTFSNAYYQLLLKAQRTYDDRGDWVREGRKGASAAI